MKKIDEKAIIERIYQLREEYAGPRGKSKFARALGISSSTYNYYENNRIAPIEVLLKICEVTGADLQWLLTGKRSEGQVGSGPYGGLLRMLDGLLDQHPDLAQSVIAFIELLCQKKGIESDKVSELAGQVGRPGWIPVLGRTAAGMVHLWDETLASEPGQAVTELSELVKKYTNNQIVETASCPLEIDLQVRALISKLKGQNAEMIQVVGEEPEQIVEFVRCEQILKMFPDSFALRIDGDSMSPRINDGDIVIVSPSVPAAQGCVCIAKVEGQIGVTCKLIRTSAEQIHLIAINERYETKIIAKRELVWALAVLSHISL